MTRIDVALACVQHERDIVCSLFGLAGRVILMAKIIGDRPTVRLRQPTPCECVMIAADVRSQCTERALLRHASACEHC